MYYSGVRKLEKTKQFCRFSVPAVVVKALTKCCVCMCFRCWLQVHQSDRGDAEGNGPAMKALAAGVSMHLSSLQRLKNDKKSSREMKSRIC